MQHGDRDLGAHLIIPLLYFREIRRVDIPSACLSKEARWGIAPPCKRSPCTQFCALGLLLVREELPKHLNPVQRAVMVATMSAGKSIHAELKFAALVKLCMAPQASDSFAY